MALTVKQKELMDKLFEGLSVEEALAACNLTKGLYVQWSNNPEWIRAYDERIESLKKQAETIIASFQPVAAVKLIALMDSEKEETARHACLDVIKLGSGLDVGEDNQDALPEMKLSKMTVQRIRKVLADANKNQK